MSIYSFIAADYELPEVHNNKKKIITVKEAIELGVKPHDFIPWEEMDTNSKVLIFDKEEDLYELEILKETECYEDVGWYTNKTYVYLVAFKYTDERANQLLNYLRTNIIGGQELELWQIWLGDKQNIISREYNYKEISLNHIKQMYDFENENHEIYSCIKIKK